MTPDPLLIRRFQFEQRVREFFWKHDFLETRTPLLVQSPGMEPHLRPIEIKRPNGTKPVFLPTSPEFAMKKLLAKGLPRIFQICSSFRDEPSSPDHHPEFTMLEFYETNVTLTELQNRVEALFQYLAKSFWNKEEVLFRGQTVDLKGPWKKTRVVDLFQEHIGIDLRTHQESVKLAEVCKQHGLDASASEPWNDLYFKLWLNLIEPKLRRDQPLLVSHYPLSQSSLCNPNQDETGFLWANRFELYVGNFELGNAFDELRDPIKQRANFVHDQKERREVYGDSMPESPLDEELLAAIEHMPPTCGIALGLDRIAMLILGVDHIDQVIPLKSYW